MKGAQVSGNLTTESRSIESGQGKSMWLFPLIEKHETIRCHTIINIAFTFRLSPDLGGGRFRVGVIFCGRVPPGGTAHILCGGGDFPLVSCRWYYASPPKAFCTVVGGPHGRQPGGKATAKYLTSCMA